MRERESRKNFEEHSNHFPQTHQHSPCVCLSELREREKERDIASETTLLKVIRAVFTRDITSLNWKKGGKSQFAVIFIFLLFFWQPKRTPSKRKTTLERAQAESEQLLKTMGGNIELEGGRRTRSSSKGTTPSTKDAATPPPAKKARNTPATPTSGRRGRPKKLENHEEVAEVSLTSRITISG